VAEITPTPATTSKVEQTEGDGLAEAARQARAPEESVQNPDFTSPDPPASSDIIQVDREPSIRPVTIKQLVDAKAVAGEGGAEHSVDGVQLVSVTFVAQLQNSTATNTFIQYRLDDGTAAIDGKSFLTDDARNAIETGAKQPIPQNAYVRVFGKLKEMNDKRLFNVDHIQQLKDMNEITYHFLEATYVHAQAKGLPTGGGLATGVGADQGYGDQMDTGMYGGGGSVNGKLRGVSDDAKKFFKFLSEQTQDNEGVNVHDIARGLRMDLNRVTEASIQLCSDGLIYSTKDEETWAILENY
jgi:replication factor A2